MTKKRRPTSGPGRRPRPTVQTRPVNLQPPTQGGTYNPFGTMADPAISVDVLTPQRDSQILEGVPVELDASATKDSQDLASEVLWYSNLDGFLGQGRVTTQLSPGTHYLVALVVDQAAATAKASISPAPSQNDLSIGIDGVVCSVDPTNYGPGG